MRSCQLIKISLLLFLLLSCESSKSLFQSEEEDIKFSYLAESPSLESEQIFCDNKNSCLKGKCLSRGDSLKVCVTAETNGQFCRAANECLSKKCADRGDGLHICMGNGAEADFCQTDGDCSIGTCEAINENFKICLKK